MSAYMRLLTPMTDEECLLGALDDFGFERSMIEVHDTPVPLVGYQGDRRPQVANIVIRRQHLGPGSNDLGFVASPTGYQLIVSDADRPQHGDGWLSQLHVRYRAHWAEKQSRIEDAERRRLANERRRVVEAQRQAVHERAKKLGYRVEETREGETIRMVLVKRTY